MANSQHATTTVLGTPKHPGGRPRTIPDAETFQRLADEYFDLADTKDDPYTVPDLAIHLGLCDRKKVWEYGQREEFKDTVKNAMARIEAQRLRMMLKGKNNVIGCIFDLKNNFGYVDKQEMTHTVAQAPKALGFEVVDTTDRREIGQAVETPAQLVDNTGAEDTGQRIVNPVGGQDGGQQ